MCLEYLDSKYSSGIPTSPSNGAAVRQQFSFEVPLPSGCASATKSSNSDQIHAESLFWLHCMICISSIINKPSASRDQISLQHHAPYYKLVIQQLSQVPRWRLITNTSIMYEINQIFQEQSPSQWMLRAFWISAIILQVILNHFSCSWLCFCPCLSLSHASTAETSSLQYLQVKFATSVCISFSSGPLLNWPGIVNTGGPGKIRALLHQILKETHCWGGNLGTEWWKESCLLYFLPPVHMRLF